MTPASEARELFFKAMATHSMRHCATASRTIVSRDVRAAFEGAILHHPVVALHLNHGFECKLVGVPCRVAPKLPPCTVVTIK